MRRRCDGNDPNLLMYLRGVEGTGERVSTVGAAGVAAKAMPCDCGRVFDDVYRSVVWPHEAF